jgi:hypothetical protein
LASEAAAVLLIVVLSYRLQQWGYNLWLDATGQKSVISP